MCPGICRYGFRPGCPGSGTAAEPPAAPVAPAAEVSKEAKEAADQMLALMKEMSATLSTVKDKATADAAAEKMAKINEKGEALSKSAQKVQAEMDAAMQARQAELLPIFMGMMTDMQRLQQADFYGSQALKDAMNVDKWDWSWNSVNECPAEKPAKAAKTAAKPAKAAAKKKKAK